MPLNYQEALSRINLTSGYHTCNLKDWQILQFCGANTATFLQGQFTCDVRNLNANQAVLGAYCNLQGRMIANFILFNYQDNYYVCLPTSLISDFIKHLKKYAVFSKVIINEIINSHISGLLDLNLVENPLNLLPQKDYEMISASEIIYIKLSGLPSRYLVIVIFPGATPSNNFEKFSNIIPLPRAIWDLGEIFSGVIFIDTHLQEKIIPQRLNWDKVGGISFNKGCYLGQEIVARLHYKGKNKYHLCHVYNETLNSSNIPIGAEILTTDEKPAAELIKQVTIPQLGWHASVILHENYLTETRFFYEGMQLNWIYNTLETGPSNEIII